jgi:hypothetical protein
VYAPIVDSKHLTFQVSGSLWQDALVMMDVQTKSLWSQVSGESISGNLVGKKLTQVPAMHTTYGQFKMLYPNGSLLKKPEKGSEGSRYASYFADRNKLGIFGRANKFQKLDGKEKVLGIRFGEKEVAVSEKYFIENSHALITDVSPPVILTCESEGKTFAAFSLKDLSAEDLKQLEISKHKIKHPGKNIAWNACTGKVLSEKGEDLSMVPVVTAYWFAWVSFFPDTDLIK